MSVVIELLTRVFFCNGNYSCSFDARLEFIKQFDEQSIICAATGSSRIFAHFNSGESAQTFSRTG